MVLAPGNLVWPPSFLSLSLEPSKMMISQIPIPAYLLHLLWVSVCFLYSVEPNIPKSNSHTLKQNTLLNTSPIPAGVIHLFLHPKVPHPVS